MSAGNIFTRDADKRIAELEKKIELCNLHCMEIAQRHDELRKLAQAAVDANKPGQLKQTYAALDALAKHLEEAK